ncbi:hypothetical protein ATCC90586_010919 [Pythium insidiosum]|nr:hypothetical protein ATCC90586_010919 [Pythium insidiosum]
MFCSLLIRRRGFLLEKKGDAKVAITALIKRLNNKFKSQLDLADVCAELSIQQSFTNSYSPEEKSIVERANGIMAIKVRTLLMVTGLRKMARANKEKLGPRVNPTLLVGYSPDTKCYLLLEIPTCKILKHRGENVKFVERFTLKHDYAEKMRLLLCRLPKAHDIPIRKSHKDALSSDYSEYWRAVEEDELSSLRAHGRC